MGPVLSYAEEITKAMGALAKHPQTVFVGQQVRFDGQRLHATLKDVPMERRIEMPVAENFQLGFCTGLSLDGYIPVSIYPRMDFLIIAADQLINHLDKLPIMGGYAPKVIIRTAVGSAKPLDPGPQHTQDHTKALRHLLKTVRVLEIMNGAYVSGIYHEALHCKGSVIVIEHMRLYR